MELRLSCGEGYMMIMNVVEGPFGRERLQKKIEERAGVWQGDQELRRGIDQREAFILFTY